MPFVVLTIRFQCATCGMTVEFPHVVNPPQLPAQFQPTIAMALPPGWTSQGDNSYCLPHEPKRVTPALLLPAGMRGN